jgi:glycosyltransferase involved in cell wall biosynthesis
MKIHILYEIKEGPWGGGNQFLKALRDNWISEKKYTDSISEADIILINSHHIPFFELYTQSKTGNKIIVHRIDGPVSLVRGNGEETDKLIYYFNHLASDGTIFQSEWSKNENYNLGYIKNTFETVIVNAPDQNLFHRCDIQEKNEKIKIIATSWSANMRKGFDIYQFLDDNLDFSRYEMTFAGNTPVKFKNIRYVSPLPSDQLADLLRNHDIYITASRNEPCSNSLIEALHCGLPAVYIREGSHGSIVGGAGEGFTGTDDVLSAIDLVSGNLSKYQSNNFFKPINEVTDDYYRFCEKIFLETNREKYFPKKFSGIKLLKIMARVYGWNMKQLIRNVSRKF